MHDDDAAKGRASAPAGKNVLMRVYPYWLYRYALLAAAALVAVFETLEFIVAGFVFAPGAVVLFAVLIAFGLRALIGGVDASETHYVVRTWLKTRRIPREEVVEITERSILSLTKGENSGSRR